MHATKIEPAAIAIFAKAPVAGYAKTRLIPRLGAEGAAALQRRMIERAVETALTARLGPVSLWCAPDCTHDCFIALAARHEIALYRQTGADLGARMLHAFATLTPQQPLLLIGVDCPALSAPHLAQCADALRSGGDAVFLPVEDGGYVLVGLRKAEPLLFADMPWGTPRVMAETRLRARAAGLRVAEPVLLWDVDEPADYARAQELGLI